MQLSPPKIVVNNSIYRCQIPPQNIYKTRNTTTTIQNNLSLNYWHLVINKNLVINKFAMHKMPFICYIHVFCCQTGIINTDKPKNHQQSTTKSKLTTGKELLFFRHYQAQQWWLYALTTKNTMRSILIKAGNVTNM